MTDSSGPLEVRRPFAGQHAIVTGGASGMGHAVCEMFLKKGATVVSFDIAEPRMRVTGIEYRRVDVSDRQAIQEAFYASTSNGSLDMLVTAAGVFPKASSIDEIDEEELARILDINFGGTLWALQAALPLLRNSGGRAVCIGSIAGRYGVVSHGPHYAASKAAVHILVRSLGNLEAANGVRVNGIAPGAIDTPMIEGKGYSPAMSPMKRFGSAHEIARCVEFLCSEASSYIAGMVLDVNGGGMTI